MAGTVVFSIYRESKNLHYTFNGIEPGFESGTVKQPYQKYHDAAADVGGTRSSKFEEIRIDEGETG